MKYLDFNTIYTNEKYKQVMTNDGCPENKIILEDDDFFGHTYGSNNNLEVIGWSGKYRSNKYYIVKCSECAKDPELFGEGVFKSTKGSLNRGQIPCGCASCFRWDENQSHVRVKRKCNYLNIKFKGFNGKYTGCKSKLILECPKHGDWCSTDMNSLMSSTNVRCPMCKIDSVIFTSKKSDSDMVNSFMVSGSFKEGTNFWRSNKLDSYNHAIYWNYTCPVCSNDEYVKNGLCSGIFEAAYNCLQKGQLSCRCGNYYWSEEQYTYRIKKKMKESGTTDKFISITGFKNSNSEFTRFCKEHGEYSTRIGGYLSDNSCCPSCGKNNQRQCYVNLIKDSNICIGLKFGITNSAKQRIKKQNSKSIFEIEQFGVWQFTDVKSCKDAEKYIKKNIKCKLFTKQEVPDGWTETTSLQNLEKIIGIYEQFGGVKIKD